MISSNYANPEWNRDEREYQELNKIESNINSYTRLIRGASLPNGQKMSPNSWIQYIKLYASELWAYFKWIKPYIEKSIRHNKKWESVLTKRLYFIEGTLEFCDKIINDGFKKMEFTPMPSNFSKAFMMLEEVENKLKETKVNLGMGVRLDKFETPEEIAERRLRNTMRVDEL